MQTIVCSNPSCKDFGKTIHCDSDGKAVCDECCGSGIQIPIHPSTEIWIALLEDAKLSRDFWKRRAEQLEQDLKKDS